MKHFISLENLKKETFEDLIKRAIAYKKGGNSSWLIERVTDNGQTDYQPIEYRDEEIKPVKGKPMEGKFVSMIFSKKSTRTKLAFERAVMALGGQMSFLNATDTQLSRGESIGDTLRVVDRLSDIIVVRNSNHQEQIEASKWLKASLINALSDLYHPTEALSDIMTMTELVGFEKITKNKACFIGDANNVARSYALACHIMEIPCVIATPFGKDFPLMPSGLEGGSVVFTDDPVFAASDARFIYTDTWFSMGEDKKDSQKEKRMNPYQINDKLVRHAKDDYSFLHCLPAYRGKEVTASIIDGAHSKAFVQAENRMHTIKALLVKLLEAKSS